MLAEYILAGWMLVIGLAEAAHLSAVFLGRSFSDAVIFFWIEVAVLCGLLLAYGIWRHHREAMDKTWQRKREQQRVRRKLQGSGNTTPRYLICGAIALLAVIQLAQVAGGGQIYLDGDMTVEQVNSFLQTNQVYQINPLTGQAYQQGMPLRLRILCLPFFYGALSSSFSIPAAQMIWQVIPVMVLLLAYLAYWSAAKALFPGETEQVRLQRMGFFLIVLLVIGVSNYAYGMDGFGLLYGGWRGVSIRNSVLLPYLVASLLKGKKLPVLLCIAAEACMVWTLYGMGVCLAVTVLWYAVAWGGRKLFPGKEKDTCGSF